MNAAEPILGVAGFDYRDLHDATRLAALHERFLERLRRDDEALAADWDAYRQGAEPGAVVEARLLVEVGRVLETFVVDLFGLHRYSARSRDRAAHEEPLGEFKKEFVVRRVARRGSGRAVAGPRAGGESANARRQALCATHRDWRI